MKRLLFALLLFVASAQAQWITTYYEGWSGIPISSIPWETATHWVYFTASPISNGGWNLDSGTPARYSVFVQAAHAAGKKAIWGTGGWQADYTSHMTGTGKTNSINSIMGYMNTYGFDGVDIDWEPVPGAQRDNYVAYMRDLKAALGVKLLTAASFTTDASQVAAIQHLDQLNIMTYDMAGAYPGWVSWPNSAVYDGGFVFPSTGQPPPSIDRWMDWYISNGVPKEKLGFGIETYGYTWSGVTDMRQDASGASSNGTVFYGSIISSFGGTELKVDVPTQTSYWSGVNSMASAESDTSLAMKAQYLRSKGLGGVIVYGIDGGWQPAVNPPDRFFKVLAAKVFGGIVPPPPPPPPVQKVTQVVFDEQVNGKWLNTSWGATMSIVSANAHTGAKAMQIQFGDWGAFDMLNGQWGATTIISADSMIFWIKSPASFNLEVGFYGGVQNVLIAGNNAYERVSVPVTNAFDRFFIRRNLSGSVTAFIDDLVIVSGDTTIIPPPVVVPPPTIPPPVVSSGLSDSVQTLWREVFKATVSSLININIADKATLQTLPGIGPTLADRIILWRAGSPFTRIEDIMLVSGIGLTKFDAIKTLIRV